MPAKIIYVFRGTTKGYEGGSRSKNLPVTCTTKNIIKALLFAMECANENPDTAVVYITKIEQVEPYRREANVIKKIEEEIAFNILPSKFYELAEGYVHIKDLQKLLNEIDIKVYQIVRSDNLTQLCHETEKLSSKELEKLMTKVRTVMKS